MAASPNFTGTPVFSGNVLTLADASRTAPANYVDIIPTAKIPSGAMVMRIGFIPVATTVVSVMRFWIYDGAAWNLLFEYALAAQTLAAGTVVPDVTFDATNFARRFPIIIGAGGSLRASVNDAQTGVRVWAAAGGF